MRTFNQKVYFIVEKIPYGKVMSYGQIARLCGNSRTSRAVGYALNATPDGCNIPWHRVVYKDGSLAQLSNDGEQYELLKLEDVTFTLDKKVDMKEHQWDGFEIEAMMF